MATALISVGAAAVITQVIVIREVFASFYGNELLYGITMMIWLMLTAVGSIIGNALLRFSKDNNRSLVHILLAVSIAPSLSILLIRISRNIMGIPLGTLPDISSILLYLTVALAPSCILLGSLFTVGSVNLGNIGKMFILESIGSLLGGLVFSFVLIFFLGHFQMVGIAGLLLCASALYIFKHHCGDGKKHYLAELLFISFIISVNAVLIYPYGAKLDKLTTALQWKGYNVKRTADSPYGKITVIENSGISSYFQNGNLICSGSSLAENEEFAALSMLQGHDGKDILLIGGGACGLKEELKGYGNIKRLDLVEPDPVMAGIAPDKGTLITDGRAYIKGINRSYDLIMVNVGEPSSATVNRFYTKEFFQECSRALKAGGTLALKCPASGAYMRPDQRDLNASIARTLSVVFRKYVLIPGSVNYYFSSNNTGSVTDQSELLALRWSKEGKVTRYFTVSSIAHLLEPFRLEQMKSTVRFNGKTRINRDMEPACYRISLQIWLSYFPGFIELIYRRLISINIFAVIGSFLALAAIFKYIFRERYSLPSLAATAYIGAGAMISQMLLIYIFQAVFGNIYYWMGILTALFMGGIALGGYAATRHIKLNPSTTAYSLMCLSLMFLVLISSGFLNTSGLVVPVLCFAFSFLTGVFFVDVVEISRIRSKGLKAAAFYSMDLFGGAIAAVVTSLILIPAYGLVGTMAVLCSLYLGSVILTAHSS